MWKLSGRVHRHPLGTRLIRYTTSLPTPHSSQSQNLPSARSSESLRRILEPILSSDIYLACSSARSTDFLGDIDSASPYEATTGLIRSDDSDEGTRFSEKRVIAFHKQLKAAELNTRRHVKYLELRPPMIEQAKSRTTRLTKSILQPPSLAVPSSHDVSLSSPQGTSVIPSQPMPIKPGAKFILESNLTPNPEEKIKSPERLQSVRKEAPLVSPMTSTGKLPVSSPASFSLAQLPPKPSTSISTSRSLLVANPKLVKAMAPTYSRKSPKPPNFLLRLEPCTPIAPLTKVQAQLIKSKAMMKLRNTPSRKKLLKMWNSRRKPEILCEGSSLKTSSDPEMTTERYKSETRFSFNKLGISVGRLNRPPTIALREPSNNPNAPAQLVPLSPSLDTQLVFNNPHTALSSSLLNHLVRQKRRSNSSISSTYVQYCIDTLNQSLGHLESITSCSPFSSTSQADPRMLRQYLHQYLLVPAFHTQTREKVLNRMFNLGLRPDVDLEILTLRALFLRQKTYTKNLAPYGLFLTELSSLQKYFEELLFSPCTDEQTNISTKQNIVDRRRIWSTIYFGFLSMAKNPIPTDLKTRLLTEARKEPIDQILISRLSADKGNQKRGSDLTGRKTIGAGHGS